MNDSPLVEVAGLSKSYTIGGQPLPVLHNISFSIPRGQFVSIMGPSGCGKSTLMNLMGCLDRPDHGEITLDRSPLSHLTDDDLAAIRNRKIGFVFQTFNLLPRLTALDNVGIPLIYAGIGKEERDRRAQTLLTQMGLEHRVHHRPTELSGGQLQRVAIARSLINKPAILLADEPTGNLDSRSGDEIMKIFHDLNRNGMTILMVTHNPEIAETTGRIIHMRDGAILKDEKRS